MMAHWTGLARCRTRDPELFFPVGTTGPALLQVTQAKLVCGRCAVREQCLSFAMENRERDGIFGGLTADERVALHRRNTRKRPAAVAS